MGKCSNPGGKLEVRGWNYEGGGGRISEYKCKRHKYHRIINLHVKVYPNRTVESSSNPRGGVGIPGAGVIDNLYMITNN